MSMYVRMYIEYCNGVCSVSRLLVFMHIYTCMYLLSLVRMNSTYQSRHKLHSAIYTYIQLCKVHISEVDYSWMEVYSSEDEHSQLYL